MKDFNLKMTRALQLKKRVKRKKDKKGSSSKFWWFLSFLIISVAYFWLTKPPFGERHRLAAENAKSSGNGKELSTALLLFAGKNDGKYPGDATGPAATVEQCFQQLIDAGYVEDETVFWSESGVRTGAVSDKKPDNDGILEPGECAWGYVKGLTTSSSSRSPMFFDSSVKPGIFNTTTWGGRAIIGKIDGSIVAAEIAYERGSTEGVILVEKDGRKVDIFADLPEGTEIMVPTPFTAK